jgi:chromosome segregation ATPase
LSINEKLKATNFELIQKAEEANEKASHTTREVERAVLDAKSMFEVEKTVMKTEFDGQRKDLETTIRSLETTIKNMPKTDEEVTQRMHEAENSAKVLETDNSMLSSRLKQTRDELEQTAKSVRSMFSDLEKIAGSRMPLVSKAGIQDILMRYKRLNEPNGESLGKGIHWSVQTKET